jgi:hypothetical protein
MRIAIRTLPAAFAILALACCRTPAPLPQHLQRVDTAMMLYQRVHAEPASLPIRRRHQQVSQYYSARVNKLFGRWESLDARFHQMRRRATNLQLVGGTLPWWHQFTTPVVGCGEFIDSIQFASPNDTRVQTITVDYHGSGPQGASTRRESLTLHFIEENGRVVVDHVHYRKRFRHSYMPELNTDTVSTLDDYIAERCGIWEEWNRQLETWLAENK